MPITTNASSNPAQARCTWYNKSCQWFAAGLWFSSTNKTDWLSPLLSYCYLDRNIKLIGVLFVYFQMDTLGWIPLVLVDLMGMSFWNHSKEKEKILVCLFVKYFILLNIEIKTVFCWQFNQQQQHLKMHYTKE